MCLLTNKRYYNISDGIFIRSPDSPGSFPRDGSLGGSKFIFSEIQPNLMCEFLTYMAISTAQFLWVGPGMAKIVKYHFISITKIQKLNDKSINICSINRF